MRQPRQLKAGARYHVTAQANRKEMIFLSKTIREIFLAVIHRAKKKYIFKLEHFCLLGNCFHFVIRPKATTSLSRIMQWTLSVFAMTFNRTKGLTGHVWGQRFYSRILGRRKEFHMLARVIDQLFARATAVGTRENSDDLTFSRKSSFDFLTPPDG